VLKDVPPHLVRLVSGCLDQADLTTAGRACQQLSDHVQKQLGPQRGRALVLLALTLAQTDCPLLVHAHVATNGQLDLAVAEAPPADAHAAVVALLTRILHLLATLEGEPAATAAARLISSQPAWCEGAAGARAPAGGTPGSTTIGPR
jgi:hypothetical protein